MWTRKWLALFPKKGINCRDALFLIIDLVIFFNILKEYWAIDNLEALDNSVERSHLQYYYLIYSERNSRTSLLNSSDCSKNGICPHPSIIFSLAFGNFSLAR